MPLELVYCFTDMPLFWNILDFPNSKCGASDIFLISSMTFNVFGEKQYFLFKEWNKCIGSTNLYCAIIYNNLYLICDFWQDLVCCSDLSLRRKVSPLFLDFSVMDSFLWFWMCGLNKSVLTIFEFLKASFLVWLFSNYTLMIFRIIKLKKTL